MSAREGDDPEASVLGLIDRSDAKELIALVNQTMPFGRFKGTRLIDLPEPYIVWFKNQGFPRGQLGQRLATMYEIKVNGLEPLLRPLVEDNQSAIARPGGPAGS